MAELPTDIITKILSLLPVKSLIRFQSVSKTWKSIIKSQNFIQTHLNHTLTSNSNRHLFVEINNPPSLYLSSNLDLLSYNRLTFSFSTLRHPLQPNQPFSLLGSRNGVVCMCDLMQTDFFIFNPLSNSCHKVPFTNIPTPEINMTAYGFGYDRYNDDYKVLRIVQAVEVFDGSQNKALVYSLRTDSWHCIENIPYYNYNCHLYGVVVNDALHFVVSRAMVYDETMFISRFDLITESFSEFSLMDFPDYEHKLSFDCLESAFMLLEIGGCLCLLMTLYMSEDEVIDPFESERGIKCVDFWVMKEYGNKESWVRVFSIRHLESIGSCRFIKPVVYSDDGRRILLEIDSARFVWYDLESEIVERITVHGLPNRPRTTEMFVGSLALVGDELLPQNEALPQKNNKKKVVGDSFLSKGFKLRL